MSKINPRGLILTTVKCEAKGPCRNVGSGLAVVGKSIIYVDNLALFQKLFFRFSFLFFGELLGSVGDVVVVLVGGPVASSPNYN